MAIQPPAYTLTFLLKFFELVILIYSLWNWDCGFLFGLRCSSRCRLSGRHSDDHRYTYQIELDC